MNVGTLTAYLNLDTSDFDSGVKGAEKEAGGLGSTLRGGLAKGAKVGAGAIAAAGAAAVTGAFKTASYGDELDKTSSRLGVHTDFLQDARYWASQNGIEASTLERATGRLTQRIGDAADGTGKYADAFEGLGVKIHDSNGDLRDSESVMRDTIDALVGIEDPAARSAAAADVFGTRVARDLMPALEDGSLTLEEATEAMDGHGRMTEEQIKASADFTDAWDDVKTSGMSLLRDGFTPVMEFMADRLFPLINDKVVPAIQTFAEWLGPRLAAAAERIGEWWDDYLEPVFNALVDYIVTTAIPRFLEMRDTFMDVWERVSEAVRNAWENWIRPALEALGDYIVTTAMPRFLEMRDTAEDVWERISTAIRWAWENIIRPAWSAIESFITSVLVPVMRTIMSVVSTVWSAISKAIRVAWRTVIKPTWDALRAVVENVLVPVFQTILSVASAVWEDIASIISNLWNNNIKPAWDAIKAFIDDTLVPAFETTREVAETVWDAVSGAVESAWEFMEPLFTALWEFVSERLSPVWETFSEAASEAWGTVTSVVGGALRTLGSMVESFLNVTARIADAVGASNLASTLRSGASSAAGWGQGFNEGGWVPGTGPDRDSVPAMLTPGEFVLSRRAASRLSPEVLAKLNDPRFSLSRGLGSTGGDAGDVFQRLNAGGYAKTPDDVIAEARRRSGPYQWGGFGPRFDCSGFMAWLSNYAATGSGRAGGRWATGMAGGQTLGRFHRGKGDPETGFSIGVAKGSPGHTAGTVAGTNVESSGGRGAHVGGARGWSYGNMRYHLPDFGGPSAEEIGWWETVRDTLSSLGSRLDTPMTDMFRETASTVMSSAADRLLGMVPFASMIRSIVGLGEGGTVTSAGSLLVGENGPELVTLPKHATVSPQDDVVGLLRQIDRKLGKRGGPVVQVDDLTIEDPVDVQEFGRKVAAAARIR